MNIRKLWVGMYGIRNMLLFQASRAASIREFMAMVRPYSTNIPVVRIGNDSDGGYILPEDFNGVKKCFSPGVADNSNFELAMARLNIKSFMADYSVDGPAIQNPYFHFEKKFLGTQENEIFTTLESWVNRHAADDGDLILQMDIEKNEYPVIEVTPSNILKKFRIIVIEFHLIGNLRNTKQLARMKKVFQKLLQDFTIIHIHPNNAGTVIKYRGLEIPRLMEFTFLRKDRITTQYPSLSFPHALDKANLVGSPDLVLPKCWYGEQ
jgi:hypothetical protein